MNKLILSSETFCWQNTTLACIICELFSSKAEFYCDDSGKIWSKRNIDHHFSKGVMLPFGKTEDILC